MDNTYAPQSPDLSSFYSAAPPRAPYATRSSTAATYAPRSPVIPASFAAEPAAAYGPSTSYAYNHQHPQEGRGGRDPSMASIPLIPASHTLDTLQHVPAAPNVFVTPSGPGNDSLGLAQGSIGHRHGHGFPDPGGVKHTPNSQATPLAPAVPSVMPSNLKNPNPQNIVIRTKFPVARIKRIMQADEEVGKVAQATPVAMTRALELFMISLVTGAADRARERGGRRIHAMHLKDVVQSDKQWDFLEDIVSKVKESEEKEAHEKQSSREKRAKSESMTEDEQPVKKREGRARKRKTSQ